MESGSRNDMTKLPKFEVGSGNVFADLGLENADELLLKAQIDASVKSENISRSEAIRRLAEFGLKKKS